MENGKWKMENANRFSLRLYGKNSYNKNIMAKENPSLKRKLAHVGGWTVAKRVAKSIPYVGTAMAIGLVGYDIKRKGVVKGVLNAGIDAIPFVGAGKNIVEFFTGDIFPDKDLPEQKR